MRSTDTQFAGTPGVSDRPAWKCINPPHPWKDSAYRTMDGRPFLVTDAREDQDIFSVMWVQSGNIEAKTRRWFEECVNEYIGDSGSPFLPPLELLREPEMKVHATGAKRTTEADATRYDLISPIALRAYARTCAEGAEKYGAWNAEKGFPATDLLNHALRHINEFLAGDTSEPHLAHALWNVGFAIHSVEM